MQLVENEEKPKDFTDEEKIEQLARIKNHVHNQFVDLLNDMKEIKSKLGEFHPDKDELTKLLFKANTLLNTWKLGLAADEYAKAQMALGFTKITPIEAIHHLVDQAMVNFKKTHKPGEEANVPAN